MSGNSGVRRLCLVVLVFGAVALLSGRQAQASGNREVDRTGGYVAEACLQGPNPMGDDNVDADNEKADPEDAILLQKEFIFRGYVAFHEERVSYVLFSVLQRSGVEVVLDYGKLAQPEQRVSVSFGTYDRVGAVLDKIMEQTGFHYVASHGLVFVSDEESVKRFRGLKPPEVESQPDKEVLSRLQERQVSFSVLEKPVPEVLGLIAKNADVRIDLQAPQATAETKTTLLLPLEVKAISALDVVVVETGLEYTIKGGVVIVSKQKPDPKAIKD